MNALSRASFNKGEEDVASDCAFAGRLDAAGRSTRPGAVMDSGTFGKPLRVACIDAAGSGELAVPLTATPKLVLVINRSSSKSPLRVNIRYRRASSVS